MACDPSPNKGDLPRHKPPCLIELPVFDAEALESLSDMIGDDGVAEMIEIFEGETRRRLCRLESGQDMVTIGREMHSLKGAAGTVAAPRISALGARFERAAADGAALTSECVHEIASAFETWLTEAKAWRRRHRTAA